MYRREARLRVVVGHEIYRRQRQRHHIDLAQLFHFETGGLVTSRRAQYTRTGRR